MTYIGVDPGNKNCGYCEMGPDGFVAYTGTSDDVCVQIWSTGLQRAAARGAFERYEPYAGSKKFAYQMGHLACKLESFGLVGYSVREVREHFFGELTSKDEMHSLLLSEHYDLAVQCRTAHELDALAVALCHKESIV
jgi:Holliday junction resolvasome RuvABC endonuclease subunit